jgi:hypothetical protein
MVPGCGSRFLVSGLMVRTHTPAAAAHAFLDNNPELVYSVNQSAVSVSVLSSAIFNVQCPVMMSHEFESGGNFCSHLHGGMGQYHGRWGN